MNQALILILSIVGLLALYWVLIGQWRFNKKLREAEEKPKENVTKKIKE